MIKCEIQYNLPEQTLDIFIFTKQDYFVYNGENYIETIKREGYYSVAKPFLKIPYEFSDELEEAFAKRFANRKGVNLSLFENTAKDSHIKDLKWILTHFINKDKNEN